MNKMHATECRVDKNTDKSNYSILFYTYNIMKLFFKKVYSPASLLSCSRRTNLQQYNKMMRGNQLTFSRTQ